MPERRSPDRWSPERWGPDLLGLAGLRSRAEERADVTDLTVASRGPSWRASLREATSALETARLLAATPRLARAPRGDGHPVVDLPGWLAPEMSGAPIRAFLRRLGYDAHGWGLGTNTGLPARNAERASAYVLRLAEERQQPVSLVGWSLGGVVAREIARHHPDAVRRVITYGSPVIGGPTYTAVARMYAQEMRESTLAEIQRLDAERPITVPITAIYTRRDGVVAWPACLDRVSPHVEHVEVASTHLGLGIDPDVWAVVADRLARPV